MTDFFRRNKIIIAIAVLLTILAVAFSIYRESRTGILDRTEMNSLARDIVQHEEDGLYPDQDSLAAYITSWADENAVEYSVDKSGNIICVSKAVERKKKVSPTIICVSYNYETVRENARLLASAAMIAKTDLKAGKKTVVFVNDEQNTGRGYRRLSKKIFKNKPKVIYMDYGSSSYMSVSSFGEKHSVIKVKAGRHKPECDTAVKVHISGIDSAVIGTGISKQPDPVNELSALLARLKSRSAIYQLADFEIGSNGNMYPVSMDATILMNSYAVSSFTKYADKRIKSWERSNGNDDEDSVYTYEVISDPEQLPEKSYSRTSTTRLTNVLYTLKSGLYKYEESDELPEGHSPGDIYGINAITDIRTEDGYICIDLITQAYDDTCMQKIMDDNTAAAELFDCTISEESEVPGFLNDKDSLQRTFRNTYFKVNSVINSSNVLETVNDSYFTPCSYLARKNSNADIIHLRLNKEQAATLTNTILCYIAFKGNILL